MFQLKRAHDCCGVEVGAAVLNNAVERLTCPIPASFLEPLDTLRCRYSLHAAARLDASRGRVLRAVRSAAGQVLHA